MLLRNVEIKHFCARLEECPNRPLPEIALSGRSNVGKSSLVNLLTGRKKLAYTSKEPGKTQVLTYYEVDESWYLVDMPGYGYAKVGAHERRRWANLARQYFHGRAQLAAVAQLLDIRVGATPDDKARLRALIGLGRPLCLVWTKADKIAPTKRDRTVGEHLARLDVSLPEDTAVVITSSLGRFGHDQLVAWMRDVLATREPSEPS